MGKLSDIDEMLLEIIGSAEFKEDLASSGESIVVYSQDKVRDMADELRTAIINAYLGIVQDPERYFDISTTEISEAEVIYESANKNLSERIEVNIVFDGAGLYRDSLYNAAGGYYTGEGVYDIFGLFTHGYTAKGVVGQWMSAMTGAPKSEQVIPNRRSRPADTFIKDAVRSIVDKYPGVQITLPPEWE